MDFRSVNTGFVDTETFAAQLGVRPQSVRHALCVKGHYMGARPVKLPNRLLRWHADAAARIIESAASGREAVAE